MSKHFSKIEEEIFSAVSIAELLELKKQVESTHFTDRDSEYLLQLIETSIDGFK